MPVTSWSWRRDSSTRARASGESACAAAMSAPSVTDCLRTSEQGVRRSWMDPRPDSARNSPGAGDCATTTPSPSLVMVKPRRLVRRRALRNVIPRTSGITGRPPTSVITGDSCREGGCTG
jgi:hypothetical protein